MSVMAPSSLEIGFYCLRRSFSSRKCLIKVPIAQPSKAPQIAPRSILFMRPLPALGCARHGYARMFFVIARCLCDQPIDSA